VPKHVNFVVNVFNDLLEFLIFDVHFGCFKINSLFLEKNYKLNQSNRFNTVESSFGDLLISRI